VRQRSEFPQLDRQLAGRGLRPTVQRRQVYAVLVQDLDHPTAQEVFLRAKRRVADISMATVYNCLDALVACGLVRPGARRSRGQSVLCQHARACHFFCERCGVVSDMEINSRRITGTALLPRGYSRATLRGLRARHLRRLRRQPGKPSLRAMA
jgi:Fur family transcriptional regulator, peroxide stress response regulator